MLDDYLFLVPIIARIFHKREKPEIHELFKIVESFSRTKSFNISAQSISDLVFKINNQIRLEKVQNEDKSWPPLETSLPVVAYEYFTSDNKIK